MQTTTKEGEIEKQYKFGRTLGSGTFATVKQATCLKDSTKWAVKIIKKSALTAEDEESLKMEIQIMQHTHHNNIVSVKEVFYSKQFVYLVMDIMTGGELFDRIVNKDHYTENEAKQALKEIAVAINYCHEKDIVHRDLKPENILYASPADDAALKLADFGLATMLKPNQLMTVACGTPGYVAPEILRGTAYGKEVDVWSIGVILYILLCGFPPFYDDNNKKLFALIINANYSFPDPYWTDISGQAKDLVRKLLMVDPKERLTAAQILEHEWMVSVSSSAPIAHFQNNLKAYNAKRRFRGAIHAIQLTSLMKIKKGGALGDVLGSSKNKDNSNSAAAVSSKEPTQATVPEALPA
mmetsp:Transcript_26053/g.43400  ORF Transcript_26053/g.43400 Transcript_26053/m.43400 type:complete len:353 (+) Transcript_26053:183-1241(+)|eukprot:CAMPEP_0174976224 /NCGR_PEP_ID=MMETSP0004_2-20121128/12908_1 /TAXON_ID=420556 /ORGANISM="Ochromonas sp., Strain CCMP1393" /LENGTH=352 /DNA_ID=CAMNT_0016227219 /DNA_START=228 /DNA_END=1286 /DNA_ORIENTATION=-